MNKANGSSICMSIVVKKSKRYQTKFQSNMPNSILSDGASDGFSVHHSFCSPTANHPAGGGLAFIHRSGIKIQPVHPGIPQPSSFELQVLRITSCTPCVTLVNAYRPPHRSLATFLEEFQDVTSIILASTNGNGDVPRNYLATFQGKRDMRLVGWFSDKSSKVNNEIENLTHVSKANGGVNQNISAA